MDTILLVEDEPLVRIAIAQHLEGCGYSVLEAENADQALRLLQKHFDIDVLFTDVRMPGSMDGLGLAKWVVQHRPSIAVMIASGHTAKDTAVKELCGAHAFTKPYSFDEVAGRIREVIQARSVS